MGQKGFWDFEKRQEKLKEQKDLLVQVNRIVPWETFRPLLSQLHDKPRKSNAGRKPVDSLVMFKMLILQQLYNLSDEELEYQVNDRLSFMRFLGLGLEDTVPDRTTVWLFRKQLQEQGLLSQLFEQFDGYLRQRGYQAKGGQIIDASLIPVPKQHNRKEEQEQLAQGEIPSEWLDYPHRLAQKDRDARWTQKGGQSHFGYKSHISIDADYGFIRRYQVTHAAVHDSQVLGEMLDGENQDPEVWADSAYRSEAIEWALEQMGFISQIHERGYRNRPLTPEQKTANRERSTTRAKVEHVFGTWVKQMGGKLVQAVGLIAVKTRLELKHLTYNLLRFVFWQTTSNCIN